MVQVINGVGRDHLALVDDDDLFADLLHFGQDVRAENDGVIAGKAFDQLARFDDLFRVEAGGRLVQNQHVGIVDDRLRQPDALPIAFRKLADQLLPHIGDGAALANFVDTLGESAGQCLSAARQRRDIATSISG